MSSDVQSLASFITEESLRLAAFEAWWRAQHAKDPASFPLQIEPGMWDEALQTFDPVRMEQVAPTAPMSLEDAARALLELVQNRTEPMSHPDNGKGMP